MKFSAAILGITLIITVFSGLEKGLGFILAIMTVVQAIVLIMTIRKSKSIRFEKEGYIVRIGSSLLHFGFVIIILNFVSMRDSSFHMLIFWIGVLFITVGNVFSFYPEKMALILPGD